ncbi:ABC transporter ATP-binding protein [Syntrophomonas palmitatica]|uniref:ABC transporter ATP-binding protein n=1 Tax=Syntrophomonas palmitatica TaxID=402877 RepID=UPI0006CFF7E4|nr:ABC transporter ATP-binding protein [Syntrophomonas palmitatica]
MLKVKNLCKKYGKLEAVNNLSFHIEEGSIFGFVGPNGAGKTSTMKIIATLLRPTSGQVLVAGEDVSLNPRRVRQLVGYMPDFFGVYDDLKVDEYLDFYAASYGIPLEQRKRISADLLELMDLSHKRDAYVDSLSRGMKQRLCLARSLVHDPALLILDEPASGLDPRARVEMREILRELRTMGKTIMISSHILPELTELCTHIGIIEAGQMAACGTVEEIMRFSQLGSSLKITVLDQVEETLRLLQEQPFINKVDVMEKTVELPFNGDEEEMSRILALLVGQGIPVVSFAPSHNNLEDIFMQVTKGVAQ